jgi:hypothetical protein
LEEKVAILIIGASALLLGLIGFLAAMPRAGRLRRFLRNDDVQAYYVVTMIVLVAMGAVTLVSALVT